jgi:hypothetical protein
MNEKLSLTEINAELEQLANSVNNSLNVDEKRLDALLTARSLNADYLSQLQTENQRWRQEWGDFISDSLTLMRSYIPASIFSICADDLSKDLPARLVRRIFQKQCLWLIRMDQEHISKLHESLLVGRYNPEAHDLDVIELSAIYASLPLSFRNDPENKKLAWAARIQERLKKLISRMEQKTLRDNEIRHPVYDGVKGIFEDIDAVHTTEIVSGTPTGRRSFKEICRAHSLLSIFNKVEDNEEESSRSVRVDSKSPPPSPQPARDSLKLGRAKSLLENKDNPSESHPGERRVLSRQQSARGSIIRVADV